MHRAIPIIYHIIFQYDALFVKKITPLVKKKCSLNCEVFGLFKPRIIVATSVSYNNPGFIS